MKGSGLTPLDSPRYGLRCYMKLLWLSISEAHTQAIQAYKDKQYELNARTTQAYKIWMIWKMLCTIKRERESLETKDQTLTTRYVSRFEPLALHPRLHHREGFPIHYLPPREPPPRRIFTTREYRTPLSNTASQSRGRPVANTTTNTSTEEGYKPNSTSH